MATVLETSRPTLRVPYDPFRNEPLTDFSQSDNARKMRDALNKVRAELGREYDMVIGGELIKTKEKITSINPAHPSQVVGVFQSAGREHVEPAIRAAAEAFESWKRTTVEQRASLVHEVACLLRERKLPVVVLWGARDGVVPRAAFDAMCTALESQGEIVEGSHSWMLADPDQFGEVMTNHVEVAKLARQMEEAQRSRSRNHPVFRWLRR